ncbi:MAG: hypothetical protein Q9160_007001 [Pyrenula sp. 1 TL-2023]
MSDHPVRPQTPQAMLHRLPDKPDVPSEGNTKPSKYIVLIEGSTAVAGKVQIAKSVSSALSCPLFQGDSLHETCAKAAGLGAASRSTAADNSGEAATTAGPNEARYRRMWLSKLTRTGHLFPDESRPAGEGFSGFGGGAAASSTSTSRRGSGSSVSSDVGISTSASSVASGGGFMSSSTAPATKYVNKPPPVFNLSENEKLRKANPALMAVTHPELEQWHKDSIRKAVGEYRIGVIFVPLYEDEDYEPPVLRPLDPRTMTSFAALGSLGAARRAVTGATLEEEIVLRVDVQAKVEDLIEEVVDGVRDIMSA